MNVVMVSFYFIFGYSSIRIATAPKMIRTELPISSLLLGTIFIFRGIHSITTHYESSNKYFLMYQYYSQKIFESYLFLIVFIIILISTLILELRDIQNNPSKIEPTLKQRLLGFIDIYLCELRANS